MKSGTLIAALVVAAYIGFEAYAIKKASHRTEPAYIYQLMIDANAATQLCKHSALAQQPRFTRTLARVSDSYAQDLSESNPELSVAQIIEKLQQQVALADQSLKRKVSIHGCDSPEMKAHFQRYRIYAGKSR
jgi:hypothetical protein